MENLIEREFSLSEILAKTNYEIHISKEKTFQSNPIAFGAGFFLNYKNKLFFITADHNIHIEDHEIKERTGIDNYLAVLNNISDINSLTTTLTPISGFYYMNKINFLKLNEKPELFDVAISLVNREKIEAPFFTNEEIKDENGNILVSPNEQKFEFLDEHIAEPNTEHNYYIFGKIHPHFKGLFLHKTYTFKNELRYIETFGDYLLLNTKDIIADFKDWAGLSGSPVINEEGKCIGMLCSVNEGSKSVFVKPFSKILPFLDTIILQEQIKDK